LEAASRAQGKPSSDAEQENNEKWSAAPKAFIEQTQLNYRARKLTALALRQYWLSSSSDLLKDIRHPARAYSRAGSRKARYNQF